MMSDAFRSVWHQVGTNDQKLEPSWAFLLWSTISAALWALILGGYYWLT